MLGNRDGVLKIAEVTNILTLITCQTPAIENREYAQKRREKQMIIACIMQIPEEIPAKWSEVSLIFHPSTFFFFFFFFLLLSLCMTELATAKRRTDRRTI